MKIGLIRENKVPMDKRVPMTPGQCKEAMYKFSALTIVVEPSPIRCFKDEDYVKEGIQLQSDLSDCDVLLGVKEVPIEHLIPGKKYFFFSHTIKEQAYNRELLRAILEKNIEMIDYEALTNTSGQRIIAFGRYAGIVGAYNGIWTYGKRYRLFDLRRAHECYDLEDMRKEYKKVKLPPIKIIVTGGGRVAKGAMEVLLGMRVRKVTPAEFLNKKFDEPVFTQLNSRDYHRKKNGEAFHRDDFYKAPNEFDSTFLDFAHQADLLIAGAFWHPSAPVLFTEEDMCKLDFGIRIIADITCDIQGSIPSTLRPSTIDDPIYDYNPTDNREEAAFTDEGNVTVMAVDNLPCELPRDASKDFGNELINNILLQFWNEDKDDILYNATITKNGSLNTPFKYLDNYVKGE